MAVIDVAAETRRWSKNRNLNNSVPVRDTNFRGCAGLGLAIDMSNADELCEIDEHRMLIPDQRVEWCSLVDVPPGDFRLWQEQHRVVRWASVAPTQHRFGFPQLFGGHRQAWDLRREPVALPCHTDTLVPERSPRELRIFNQIDLSMTAFAYRRLASWRKYNDAYRQEIKGLTGSKLDSPYICGPWSGAELPQADKWFPVPYVAFPSKIATALFGIVTVVDLLRTEGDSDYRPVLWPEFLAAAVDNFAYRVPFCGVVLSVREDLYHRFPVIEMKLRAINGTRQTVRFSRLAKINVKEGTEFFAGAEIASDPIEGVRERASRSADIAWYQAATMLGNYFSAFSRIWFERCMLSLRPGVRHIPLSMMKMTAARADTTKLFWDVGGTAQFYDDESDAYIFPPMPLRRPQHLTGSLPGGIAFDLRPCDSRYRAHCPVAEFDQETEAGDR